MSPEIMKAERVANARAIAVLALLTWLLLAVVAGSLGWVNQPNVPPLVLLVFLIVPIVCFIVAYAASVAFRTYVDSISLTWLVGVHVIRFVGFVFLGAASAGALAKGFAYPAGIGDVIAALGALLLIPMLRKGTASRGLVLVWNTYGLLDLLNAIAVGLLYSNSSIGVLARGGHTTALMTTFPLSLIPTFFVPALLLTHLLIFKKLAHHVHLAAHGRVIA